MSVFLLLDCRCRCHCHRCVIVAFYHKISGGWIESSFAPHSFARPSDSCRIWMRSVSFTANACECDREVNSISDADRLQFHCNFCRTGSKSMVEEWTLAGERDIWLNSYSLWLCWFCQSFGWAHYRCAWLMLLLMLLQILCNSVSFSAHSIPMRIRIRIDASAFSNGSMHFGCYQNTHSISIRVCVCVFVWLH